MSINTVEDFDLWWFGQFRFWQYCHAHELWTEAGEWWTPKQIESFCKSYKEINALIEQVADWPEDERLVAYKLVWLSHHHGQNHGGMIDRAVKLPVRKQQREAGKGNKGRTDFLEARRVIRQLIEAGELRRHKSLSLKSSAIIKTLDKQRIERPSKRTIERWLNELGK